MEAVLYSVVSNINEYLSSYILVVLLLAVGLWYSVRTRFVQVRCFGAAMRQLGSGLKMIGKKSDTGMTSFQALATAIGAQVGTGNIVGASGAILTGGPGAIFWMWIIAFFGMATSYAEATLAVKTRKVENGEIKGGPVYYIRTAFTGRGGIFLAGFFAVATIIALGFAGGMVQTNSISATVRTAFGIPPWIMGLGIAVLCAVIFTGGVSRIAAVSEKIVPLMAAIFIVGTLVLIFSRIGSLPAAIGLIFKYAFVPQAIIGGGFGAAIKTAISQGAKRGLFSNEAGMGSTPHAHALADVKDPHDQGLAAMVGVFIDTFVVLTLVAVVIIITLYTKDGILASGVIPQGTDKTNLLQIAIGTVWGERFGAVFVAVCLFFFAFSSILGWVMYGKMNVVYLCGKKDHRRPVIIYTLIALVCVFLGSITSNDFVWELTDMFNNLMVLPNAVALLALTGLVLTMLKRPHDSGALKTAQGGDKDKSAGKTD